ncbi:MAG: hypothetical protein KDK70_15040 [Myxococcales bacterium]|nr:hypothetical protein [Myxococcales bacterium]
MHALPRACLRGALSTLVLGVVGCGAVEGAWGRVRAWWSDEPVVPAGTAAETAAGAAETVAAAAGGTGGAATSSTAAGGSAGDAGGTGVAAADTGAGASPVDASTGDADTRLMSGSTTIPMSFARPPADDGGTTGDATAGDATGGGSEGTGDAEAGGGSTGAESGASAPGTTGGTMAGAAGDPSCLAGTWAIDDFSAYFQRIIRVQAHGRSVRTRGSTGRYTLEFDGSDLHGEAEHLRLRYSTVLADREVSYTIDIHGRFDATVALEGPDRLRVEERPATTMRAKETARFEGGKVQTRRPALPIGGLYELDCSALTLELRPIEGGKAREAIRFVRPRAGGR